MTQTPFFALLLLFLCRTCSVFPVWEPNDFATPPAPQGPYNVQERVVSIADGADGAPFGITVFAPIGAPGPRPLFVWVMGSNVQAYYHQSLHETLASWGFLVAVPDTRPLVFCDAEYHWRNTALGIQTIQLGIQGVLGPPVDTSRIAVGGYSIGATMAAFVDAAYPASAALVLWSPSPSPIWQGVNPGDLLPQVAAPSLFLLAELEDLPPTDPWPRAMQQEMARSHVTEVVIPEGLHLYFQQPTGADSQDMPTSTLTRYEQQGVAIQETLRYLHQTLRLSKTPSELRTAAEE